MYRIVLSLALVVGMLPVEAKAAPLYLGRGAASCGKATDANDWQVWYASAEWAMGYMSGINAASGGGRYARFSLKFQNIAPSRIAGLRESVQNFLVSYCPQHREVSIRDAAEAFMLTF